MRRELIAGGASFAILVAGVMAVITLAFGGIFLAGVDYFAAWKGAMNQCVATAPGSAHGKALEWEVHPTSSWLPYYDCVMTFKDGTVRHRSLHVWRP